MSMMTRSRPPVKSIPRRPSSGPFGLGILRGLPTYRAPYTADDAAWYAETLAAEPPWDALYAEFTSLAELNQLPPRTTRSPCMSGSQAPPSLGAPA